MSRSAVLGVLMASKAAGEPPQPRMGPIVMNDDVFGNGGRVRASSMGSIDVDTASVDTIVVENGCLSGFNTSRRAPMPGVAT